jgi:xylose isomerase
MNKLAIISGFLGSVKNRYMSYQEERPLKEKFNIASQVKGIEGFELCYPADFENVAELKALLERYRFGVAAVNYRSRRTGQWLRGSFTSAHASERQAVVDDLKRAMDYAAELKCNRITTCPLNDGSDNLFEMDYLQAHEGAMETLSAACAHNRQVRIGIEYKESDPRARCFFGSAGETASFCQLTGADNLGVTLDIGHAIYGGERAAQVAVALHQAKRLFYVHLNDNDGRWDWDMLPGAYHLWEFVEFFYYLRLLGYDNNWYAFDVYAKEIDLKDNFDAAVMLTRKMEQLTDRIDKNRMAKLLEERNPSKTVPYLYSLL